MKYADQLKHPMWQRKRLEALEAAGFECSNCGEKDSMLHVHHKQYVKGRKAWEYDLSELEVLCGPCHESAHESRSAIDTFIAAHHFAHQESLLALMAGYLSASYDIDVEPPREEEIRQKDPIAYFVGYMAAHLHRDTPAATAELARKIYPLLGDQTNHPSQLEANIETLERYGV